MTINPYEFLGPSNWYLPRIVLDTHGCVDALRHMPVTRGNEGFMAYIGAYPAGFVTGSVHIEWLPDEVYVALSLSELTMATNACDLRRPASDLRNNLDDVAPLEGVAVDKLGRRPIVELLPLFDELSMTIGGDGDTLLTLSLEGQEEAVYELLPNWIDAVRATAGQFNAVQELTLALGAVADTTMQRILNVR